VPNALAHLQSASDTISRVRDAADQLHTDLQRLADDRDYTPEAKQRRRAPLLAHKAELQQELAAARGRLDRAERDAARQLRDAGAADLAQQTRTSRAAQRVDRLVSSVPVTDAAKVLALDEDADGLRALREALPAHLAVQAKEAGGERLDVERVQAYVDEVTLPLVTGTEQNALLARTQLAAERSRLDATMLYVGVGPSPSNRLVLGYAEADRQRRVNPRTGRLDAAAGRSRMAAADNGDTAA
jgi:chromosome segregation ATPase